jgi:iron complex outermembrane receptor protein
MKNFLFSIFFVFLFTGLSAQYLIKGFVRSSSNNDAIGNCSITLIKDNGTFIQKVYTDKSGYFMIANVVVGNYKLSAYESGFKPGGKDINITQDKTDIVLELQPLQVVSDEVIVESIKNKKSFNATHTNLDNEQVKKLNMVQDLPVILSTTPSAVSTSDAGTSVGYTGVRIRGIDATRINVTINGVPLNDAESHGVYWVDLPDLAGNINSIQVQRGIGSSTNGSAAFGSSINIQTTKSSLEPYTIFTSAYGSYNTFKNSIKFGTGLLKSHWTCEGSLSMIKSDGYIDRASSNLKSAYGTITRYGDKSLLKFIVMQGHETTYQAWYGVPQDSLATHRTYNIYNYKNETDNYSQTHYQLLYSYACNPKLNLNAVVHYTKGKGYYESYNSGATLANYNMPDFQLTDSTSKTNADLIDRKWLDNDFYGTIISAVYKEKKYEINVGASYNNYIGLHYNEVIWGDVWTAPKPNGNFEPFRYYNDKAIKNDGNVYAKIFYAFSKHINLFGDMQVRALNYNFNNASLENVTKSYVFYNPKVGINYLFNDSSNLLIYFGRSAHEPTRDEFVGSTSASLPKAEYLNDLEIGYTKKYKSWTIIANFYNMSYTDQLVLTGRLNDVGSPVRENVKSSYRRGIELVVQRQFNNGFSINANVTYAKSIIQNYKEYLYDYSTDSAYIYNYKTTPISFSPDLIFGSSLKYNTLKHFELELLSKYVSKQFLDNSGSDDRKLHAYFVNDFYLRYHFVKQKMFDDLNISAVVYNVLSTLYESNGASYGDVSNGVRNSYNYYYPQAPRHFALMLQLKF